MSNLMRHHSVPVVPQVPQVPERSAWLAYEKSWETGGLVRHVFRSNEERSRWIGETCGLTLASEGGRGYLRPEQEDRLPMRTPTIYHGAW